ncbi:uncharacterized protein PG986_007590 [Apiospora aurea]|uniref:Uncharacterized protein n=1 Tax=Apiospora aurea TaxID=335848 RepID=A0ABR1QD08_9PEZI
MANNYTFAHRASLATWAAPGDPPTRAWGGLTERSRLKTTWPDGLISFFFMTVFMQKGEQRLLSARRTTGFLTGQRELSLLPGNLPIRSQADVYGEHNERTPTGTILVHTQLVTAIDIDRDSAPTPPIPTKGSARRHVWSVAYCNKRAPLL